MKNIDTYLMCKQVINFRIDREELLQAARANFITRKAKKWRMAICFKNYLEITET